MAKKNNEYDGSRPLQSFMQEAFVDNLLNGMGKGEAYTNAGYKSKSPTAHAIRLANKGKVAVRIAYKQGELAQRTKITVEGQIERLRQLSEGAVECKQFAAAISAEDKINTMCGLYQKDNQQKQQKILVAPIIRLYNGNGN